MGGAVLKFLGPFREMFYKLINAAIKSKLGKTAEDFSRITEVIAELVFKQVLAAQGTDASNEEKHKQVADQVIAIIKEDGGIELSDWVLDYLNEYLDDLITAAVEMAKKSGLFPA